MKTARRVLSHFTHKQTSFKKHKCSILDQDRTKNDSKVTLKLTKIDRLYPS